MADELIKNVQSVIDQIASETEDVDGDNTDAENTDDENTTTEDPQQLDNPDEGITKPETDPDPDDEKKTGALIAQRKEISELKKLLKERDDLIGQLKGTGSPEGKPESQDNKGDKGDKPTEENSDLKVLQERLDKLEKEKEKELSDRQQAVLTHQLLDLKSRYNLTTEDLYTFAKDADARNLNLSDGNLSVHDIYGIVYQDKIIQSEVDKALKQLNPNVNLPSGGPKGSLKGSDRRSSIRDTINAIEKETSN